MRLRQLAWLAIQACKVEEKSGPECIEAVEGSSGIVQGLDSAVERLAQGVGDAVLNGIEKPSEMGFESLGGRQDLRQFAADCAPIPPPIKAPGHFHPHCQHSPRLAQPMRSLEKSPLCHHPSFSNIPSSLQPKTTLFAEDSGRTFCIAQAFFPEKSKRAKLAKAPGDADAIEEDAFDALSRLKSLPFPRPARLGTGESRRVAVKVIDPRGNEGLRVLTVKY